MKSLSDLGLAPSATLVVALVSAVLQTEYEWFFSGIKSPLPKSKNLVSGLSPSVSKKCPFSSQVLRENK